MSDSALATSAGAVHLPPPPKEQAPKARRAMMFFDRIKVLFIIALVIGFAAAKKAADLPILSFREALTDQLKAKQWMLWVGAIEIVRQLHYIVSERSKGWNHFWSYRFFGGWDRFWGRRNPWMRYRLGRLFRTAVWIVIAMFVFAFLWGTDPLRALVEAPSKLWNNAFSTGGQMPMIISIAFTLMFGVGQFAAIFWFMSRGGVDTYMPDEIDTRFDDVWGQDRVVEKVKENIVFLEKPEEIEAKGGHVPSGILLWGPPGTGKTLIAKAVAGETGRPYVFVDPGAFQNMFFGVGILKVKALFRKLRKLALRHGGVIVFFDEADSLGNRGIQVAGKRADDLRADHEHLGCNGMSYLLPETLAVAGVRPAPTKAASAVEPRGGIINRVIASGMGGGGGGMGTLQALLTEISGLEKPRGYMSRRIRKFLTMPAKKPPKYRILLMMATNAPDALDEALLRPGRLDRQYKVDYPTHKGRVKTYEGYFNKIKHTITGEQIDRLALMSPDASGAVIKDIVNESIIVALRDGRDTVQWPDVLNAKGMKTHGMPDDVHPVSLERHAVAVHEAGHAVAAYRLKPRWMIDVATIEPRGDTGGFVSRVPLEEPTKFPWRVSREHDVMIALASLAAERHFFAGDNSSGVGGDLQMSTAVVRSMESRSGMGSTITSFDTGEAGDPTKADYDQRVERRLRELYDRTVRLIQEDERFVLAIAHALERHHTITGEDVDAIFKGTKGPQVDGSWYHTEEFAISFGRFHQAALEAHISQGRLTVPLPVPGQVIIMSPSAPVVPAPLAVGWADGEGNHSPNGNGNGSGPTMGAIGALPEHTGQEHGPDQA